MHALGIFLSLLLVSAEPTAEDDVFWHDVTLRLDGALPNTHERLSDHLELYLGRKPDGTWRRYVLGFSALFDPKDLGVKDHKLYNWIDDEGTLAD